MKNRILITQFSVAALVCGQVSVPPKPAVPAGAKQAITAAPAKAAAAMGAKLNPRVEEVIQMVKDGIGEPMIIRKLQIANKPLDPSSAEMKAMKRAGVSDRIVEAMMMPGSAPVALPPKPAGGQTPATTPTPQVAGGMKSPSDYNSNLDELGCVMEPRKRSIAVSEFDYGAVKTALQATLGTDVNIGKGIMALLQKRLQTDGNYRIVERAGLETLKKEQIAGTSSGVKQGTAAKMGKFIGADAYLMGTIVTFGNDDKKKTIGAGGLSRAVPLAGAVSFHRTSNKAVVAISARLVDTETGELIDTIEARGEAERKGKGIDIFGAGSGGAGGGGFDMSSSNFAETLVGEATMKCIDDLAAKMIAQRAKVKMRRVEAEGRIAELVGKNLYLNVGDNDGIKKCDRFEVSKITQEVKDPVTKEVIDLVLEKVGELLVTEVRPAMSIGIFNGTAAPEKNMAVRKVLGPEFIAPPPPPTPAPAPAAAK